MPVVAHQYNQFMSGVDLADQLRQYYSAGRRSKKYWKYIFWFLVDVSICNAFAAPKAQLIASYSSRQRTDETISIPLQQELGQKENSQNTPLSCSSQPWE